MTVSVEELLLRVAELERRNVQLAEACTYMASVIPPGRNPREGLRTVLAVIAATLRGEPVLMED